MIRRPKNALLAVVAGAFLAAACGTTPTGPALTDPREIVTAALTSTENAKSVHLAVAVDGEATVALPIGGGTATPLDLTGTTASADIDFIKPAAKATFALKAGLTVNGEVIAVDGKTYLKSTLTGPLYEESAGSTPVDPSAVGGLIDNLGDLLLNPDLDLVKGDDIACGSKQCYTVSADVTAADLGTTGSGTLDGLPVNLAGASLKLTIRVEKDLPYHLAGVTAVLSQPDGGELTVDVTASKWDEPVTISAPPADQVKPAS
jgi:LppX_LprAFG lipoprotein